MPVVSFAKTQMTAQIYPSRASFDRVAEQLINFGNRIRYFDRLIVVDLHR